MIYPIVSICIPTNGRVNILRNTLISIFSQDVDISLYEVCISDNSQTDETKDLINNEFSVYSNLRYLKSNCIGFMNSIEALQMGQGAFLKLHNNYTKFNDNTLNIFISSINNLLGSNSFIFYSFGYLDNNKTNSVKSFNTFMSKITFYSTWSTSFGIWKSDFDILSKTTSFNEMFPHTSLLFNCTDKHKYIIDNVCYFTNQDVGRKGGYNLPVTFGKVYLDMVKTLHNNKAITKNTYNKISRELYFFIIEWYFNTKYWPEKYCFDFTDWVNVIKKNWGVLGIINLHLYYNIRKLIVWLKQRAKK